MIREECNHSGAASNKSKENRPILSATQASATSPAPAKAAGYIRPAASANPVLQTAFGLPNKCRDTPK